MATNTAIITPWVLTRTRLKVSVSGLFHLLFAEVAVKVLASLKFGGTVGEEKNPVHAQRSSGVKIGCRFLGLFYPEIAM